MRIPAILCLLIVFAACSFGPVPKDILQPDKMQMVMIDMIRVDEFVNNFVVKDSTVNLKLKRSTLYEQVFKLHKTSRKQFYVSYKYYQQHPDVQKGLYDSLYETLNRKKIEVGRADSAKATK